MRGSFPSSAQKLNNKGNNVVLTFNGISLNIQQWNKKLGFKGKNTLSQRLRYDWSLEKALTKI